MKQVHHTLLFPFRHARPPQGQQVRRKLYWSLEVAEQMKQNTRRVIINDTLPCCLTPFSSLLSPLLTDRLNLLDSSSDQNRCRVTMVAWRLVALQKQRVTVLTTAARLINTERLPDGCLQLRDEEPQSPSHKKYPVRIKTQTQKPNLVRPCPGSHLHGCAGSTEA